MSPAEKLHHPRWYVSGPANDCIEGYLLEASDSSYHDAETRLEERFGENVVVANPYRKKLEDYPKIKDGKDLLKFSDIFQHLESAMRICSR